MIAALAALQAIDAGYQVAVMAPTEILAEQHYRRFVEWLTPLGLKAGLFVGKAGTRERRQLRQELLNGQIHVAIGTHALIQDDVEFQNLGVVVVDEQDVVRHVELVPEIKNEPNYAAALAALA